MKPAQIPAAVPPLTFAPTIIQQAPAPALISADVGAEHVGCTRAALSEHFGWMTRQARWRDRVIVASQKRRFAAPADIIESMRDRYATSTEAPPAANDGEPTVDSVLAELGHVRKTSSGKRGGR